MKRRMVLLLAVGAIAAFASAPLAGATPPEGVTITIDETFHAECALAPSRGACATARGN